MDRAISLEARRVDLTIEPPFRLGSALIDPRAHEITWGNESRRIQPLALKVLVALHDKIGQVVTRDELVDRCWDGRFVGEDVINRCISLLRRVAAESGGIEIQTVPRGGYRLIKAAAAAEPKRAYKRWMVGGTAAIAAAVGVIAFSERGGPSNARALVAIEPLGAASDDRAAQALSEGMSSSIERDLAGSGTPVEMIDRESRNGATVELRGATITDHGELRSSLQLVNRRSGNIIWAANFERPSGELDQLRDQLSLQVARELHCAYADGRKPYFDADIEFARLSLAHCDALGRDRDEAVRLDAQIVQRAPGFARGWSEYAVDTALGSRDLPSTLSSAGFRRAIAFAHRALSLDPHQGLAYAAIGAAIQGTTSWEEQERLARRALVADPQSPEVHNWQSGLFTGIGRLQDGLNEARISYQLDHFLPGKIDQLAWINITSGYFDDAQNELSLARRYWPDSHWFDSDVILLGEAGRSTPEALKLLATHHSGMDAVLQREVVAFLGWRVSGTAEAKRMAVSAIGFATQKDGPSDEQVQFLAELGELDAAYRLADQLPLLTNDQDVGWFSPGLAAFRADSRFMPFAARLGLAQIWLRTGLWPDFCVNGGNQRTCQQHAEAAVRAKSKPGARTL